MYGDQIRSKQENCTKTSDSSLVLLVPMSRDEIVYLDINKKSLNILVLSSELDTFDNGK